MPLKFTSGCRPPPSPRYADHQLVVTGDEVGRIRRVFCDAVDAHRFGGVVTVCADFGIHHDGLFSFVAVTCRICHGRGHVVRAIGQRRARHIQRPLAIGDAQAVIRRVIGAVEVHRQAVALRQVHATADHQLVVTGDEVGRIRRVFCDAVDAHRFGGVVTVCAISVSTTMVCSALSLLPAVSVTVAVTS